MELLTREDITLAFIELCRTSFMPRIESRLDASQLYATLAPFPPTTRETHRATVDALIDLACSDSSPRTIDAAFAAADTLTVALLWDRLHSAQHTLDAMYKNNILAMAALETPRVFAHRLLLQQFSGSA